MPRAGHVFVKRKNWAMFFLRIWAMFLEEQKNGFFIFTPTFDRHIAAFLYFRLPTFTFFIFQPSLVIMAAESKD
jgi:hypothetical protein